MDSFFSGAARVYAAGTGARSRMDTSIVFSRFSSHFTLAIREHSQSLHGDGTDARRRRGDREELARASLLSLKRGDRDHDAPRATDTPIGEESIILVVST